MRGHARDAAAGVDEAPQDVLLRAVVDRDDVAPRGDGGGAARDPRAAPLGEGRTHGGEALRHAMTLEVGQVRAVVHHTPGHSADSVSLVASLSSPDDVVVLTGDTVLGRGKAVIADPDGDLGDYLTSLEVLLGLMDAPVLPGHGPVGGRLRQRVQEYQRHRRERLEQVRHAVAQGARTAEEVVAAVYTEVADDLREAAHMSARAHLRHLGVPH